jgi:hypothetical protein
MIEVRRRETLPLYIYRQYTGCQDRPQDPFKGRDVNKEADDGRGEQEQKGGVPETARDPEAIHEIQ